MFLYTKIAELQAAYDNSIAEKETLTKNIAQTAARLKRASKLTTALGDEQGRWTENVAVRQCLFQLCKIKIVYILEVKHKVTSVTAQVVAVVVVRQRLQQLILLGCTNGLEHLTLKMVSSYFLFLSTTGIRVGDW